MNFFNKQKNISIKGFTLIETMIAVFILTTALFSLLSLTTSGLFSAKYSNNEITANYLIQEAVDYIRNDRDSSVIQQSSSGSWKAFLDKYGKTGSSLCFSTSGCELDVIESFKSSNGAPSINTCNLNTLFKCKTFSYNKDPGSNNYFSFYNYSTIIPLPNNGLETSDFKRKIKMKTSSVNIGGVDTDELDITVTVEWLNGNLTKTRSLKTSLLNWQNI